MKNKSTKEGTGNLHTNRGTKRKNPNELLHRPKQLLPWNNNSDNRKPLSQTNNINPSKRRNTNLLKSPSLAIGIGKTESHNADLQLIPQK